MRELYVWYRVAPGPAPAARRAVLTMQAELRAGTPGLAARLLVRADANGAVQTWMESYALPGRTDGISHALEVAIARRAASVSPLIEGERHVEAFLVDTG